MSKWRVYRDLLRHQALHPWVAYHNGNWSGPKAGGICLETWSYHATWESALHHANINSGGPS